MQWDMTLEVCGRGEGQSVSLALKAKCLIEISNLSLRQVLTLAQIIQKEEGESPEKQMNNFLKSFQNQM